MTDMTALDALFATMPPVVAMQIRASHFDGARLLLEAPLAANLNDKGCAFGGSLVSVMTLAGWGRVVLGLEAVGIKAEVYVADSQVRYLAPLFEDLRASASLAPEEDWGVVLNRFRERGRSRVMVDVAMADASGRIVATMSARYAILNGHE